MRQRAEHVLDRRSRCDPHQQPFRPMPVSADLQPHFGADRMHAEDINAPSARADSPSVESGGNVGEARCRGRDPDVCGHTEWFALMQMEYPAADVICSALMHDVCRVSDNRSGHR